MYVLAKDITNDGRVIPKGTRLSDVYEMHDRSMTACANIWGQRIKLQLVPADLLPPPRFCRAD